MWYFSWILGVLLACAFAIINILWYEFQAGGFEENETIKPESIESEKNSQ